MKSFFWSFIFIFCTWSLFFIGKGIDNIDIMSERYKRALDAGANAASSYRAYNTGEMLRSNSKGFGNGIEDSSNIEVDKDEALCWFYRLFFRNLGISSSEVQVELKKHIIMKALICYDKLMIADSSDNWNIYYMTGEREYIIKYRGRDYKFTLSDQVYDIEGGFWTAASNIGLEPEERKTILVQYITGELNGFLDKWSDKEKGYYYKIIFSMTDGEDEKLNGIKGINFLVFSEGMPIHSLNPFQSENFFAYSIGGSEITRID